MKSKIAFLHGPMVAKTANAMVIAVDPLRTRRERAMKYGADAVINPAEENVSDSRSL